MATSLKSKLNIEERFVLVILYAIVLIGLLFTFTGIHEFYNIKIDGKESGYAFGPVADNQWYYQSASIYSAYNLVSGLLFGTAFFTAIWGTIKRSKKILLAGVGMTIILLVATFISTNLQ